ncbi:MAG TPA: hypothetical protein DHW02_12375 [Ktedonobacter sp.]|nr:hypothetical protein [Ktedonobacter sp.]
MNTMIVLTKRPFLRSLLLAILLLLSVGLYAVLSPLALPVESLTIPFVIAWMIIFIPYFVACGLVLMTRVETTQRRWFFIEMSIILFGALLFRVMLLPQIPNLSHDSWRYLWDARVILHGYSPYINAPNNPIYKPLQDALIYGNSRFRNVPTVYPPVAEYVYVLSYMIAPSNLFFLKLLFVLMDFGTSCIIAIVLARRGLDPRRTILYAWCPLPIVEYAINGHVDALTVVLIALVLLVATSPNVEKRSMRILLGFLIALATLTKFYPILLLVAVVRRRDYLLVLTCFATIIVCYVPFLILGHGQVLGFFSIYADEQGLNEGVVPLFIQWVISDSLHMSGSITLLVQRGVDVLLAVPIIALVFIQRLRERMSIEMAGLILTGLVYAVSPHIFPWYTPALLLFIPLLVHPLWMRHEGAIQWSGKGIAMAATWYFACASIAGYFFSYTLDWMPYYIFVYDVVVLLLAIAGCIAMFAFRNKGTSLIA